jgi:hypothetical protein
MTEGKGSFLEDSYGQPLRSRIAISAGASRAENACEAGEIDATLLTGDGEGACPRRLGRRASGDVGLQ